MAKRGQPDIIETYLRMVDPIPKATRLIVKNNWMFIVRWCTT